LCAFYVVDVESVVVVALGYLRKEVEGHRVGSMVWEKIALQLSETFTLKKTRAHLD